MNERIRQLAKQAWEVATTRHPLSNIVLSVNNEKFEEKFAELIVKESMDVVAKKCASPTAYNALAEHWGVEE
jgi:hypothetical protein